MEPKCKVLIGDDTLSYGKACAKELGSKRIEVITTINNGKTIFDLIQKERPDIVVIDYFATDMNAYVVIEQAERFLGHSGYFIVTSAYDNALAERRISQFPNTIYLMKPFDYRYLCQIILHISSEVFQIESDYNCSVTTKIYVERLLTKFGISAKLKGYTYLRDAILWGIEQDNELNFVTKMLYPMLAKKYETSSSCVERAIRKAIESGWNHGGLKQYYAANKKVEKRPSNQLFMKEIVKDILQIRGFSQVN